MDAQGSACNQAILNTLTVGSQKILETLLSLGCLPSTEHYKQADLLEAVFCYQPMGDKDYTAFFESLNKAGFSLSKITKKELFSINSLAIRSQAMWERIMASDQLNENKKRYGAAVKELLTESVTK